MLSALRSTLPILILIASLALPDRAEAQLDRTRYGLGFNTLLSTDSGLGFGFLGRASAPVNNDLSFAGDIGFTGFILKGREDATYLFEPQFSVIITLPGRAVAPYILGGIGAQVALSNRSNTESGPTLHIGIGWVRPLEESTLFYEINPALVIGRDDVNLALPFRLGIIF